MQTLAEDLLLLALDDTDGIVSWHHVGTLSFGLGGALLMDLALLGRIECSNGPIKAIDVTATGDVILDELLESIRATRPHREPRYWVRTLERHRDLQNQLARRLVDRGILVEQDRVFLMVFREYRFPTNDPGPETALRDLLRDIVLAEAEPDTRSLLLLSLVKACRLIDILFSRQEREHATRRITELTEPEPLGAAVGAAIADVTAAITAAITAATFTAVVGPRSSS